MKLYLSNLKKILVLACYFSIATQSLANNSAEIITLPYYNSAEFSPKWLKPESEALKTFHTISDFTFLNQEGLLISQKNLENKLYVASFFFTSCPGICPKMRSQLSKVQQAFLNDEQVKIISHSIQPENDTVEVLKKYADDHGVNSNQWHLVTGDRDKIYEIARQDYFASEDLGEFVSNENFLHTENLVLVDYNRHIRGIYNGLNKISVKHLIEDIKVLKLEQTNNQ